MNIQSDLSSADEDMGSGGSSLLKDVSADEIYEKVMSSGIYEKGFKQGEFNSRREAVLSLFEFGMSVEEIAQALNLNLKIVNEMLLLAHD